MVEKELLKESTAHWLARLSGQVPVAPVYVKQALDNPPWVGALAQFIRDVHESRKRASWTWRC